mmetsp:Transcript_146332/g.272443  ORF Transcript_146332/g.272443 Transcript_146332/m.272443 type:complete len:243 (+) Transcript_146332:93-821(+)
MPWLLQNMVRHKMKVSRLLMSERRKLMQSPEANISVAHISSRGVSTSGASVPACISSMSVNGMFRVCPETLTFSSSKDLVRETEHVVSCPFAFMTFIFLPLTISFTKSLTNFLTCFCCSLALMASAASSARALAPSVLMLTSLPVSSFCLGGGANFGSSPTVEMNLLSSSSGSRGPGRGGSAGCGSARGAAAGAGAGGGGGNAAFGTAVTTATPSCKEAAASAAWVRDLLTSEQHAPIPGNT